jgi:hypothetical protein
MVFLHSNGVRTARAVRIYKTYGADAVQVMSENPYWCGVSRDGRQLHWQAMTWDQLSNLEEEDLRAIVAYVRLLPPVKRIVPVPRPPAADDCETYTFYLDKSDQPGCR